MKLNKEIMAFHAEANEMVPYLDSHSAVLRLTDEQITEATEKLADWNPKFAKYSSTITHNDGSVKDIHKAYDEFLIFIDGIRNQVRNDKNVVLDGDEHAVLRINEKKKKRNHVPKPGFAPKISLRWITHLVIFLYAMNPNNIKKRKKPVDVKNIGIKIAVVGADDPQPAADKFHAVDPSGKTFFELHFKPEQVGMRVYVIIFYMNNRGEAGPESEVFKSYII